MSKVLCSVILDFLDILDILANVNAVFCIVVIDRMLVGGIVYFSHLYLLSVRRAVYVLRLAT